MNETMDFPWISLVFPPMSFLCPRIQSTLHLVAVPLVSSHVWQFLGFSSSFTTLSFLFGTSQLPCRRSFAWICGVFPWLNWAYSLLKRIPQRWYPWCITSGGLELFCLTGDINLDFARLLHWKVTISPFVFNKHWE